MSLIAVLVIISVISGVWGDSHFADIGEYPSVIGKFNGMADWYEFRTDPPLGAQQYGSPIENYKQKTRLQFTEQQGPFFRGVEYYALNEEETEWEFVANLFGIMSGLDGMLELRINEYLNEDDEAIEKSTQTMGVFTGKLINNSTMFLQYTGLTSSKNKFGAQHMVLVME
jgi:hypothetical protein